MSWDEIVTGLIEVTNGANADVNVYYRYMPREMSSPTDVPELPSYMHSAIPYYVVHPRGFRHIVPALRI